jgi:TfoX/Sxy family transcriptional regulator of competence genes
VASRDSRHSGDAGNAGDTESAVRSELRALLGDDSGVELRPMFGTLAALVDGHVFAVATDDVVGVKLDPEALTELAAAPDSGVLRMGGRQMKAYRSLPAGMPSAERRAWLLRAREHVASLHA